MYEGYRKEDIKLVNRGMFWIGVLIVARYLDFFYDLMSRSLFFIAAGLILETVGTLLERKRIRLKKRWSGSHGK